MHHATALHTLFQLLQGLWKYKLGLPLYVSARDHQGFIEKLMKSLSFRFQRKKNSNHSKSFVYQSQVLSFGLTIPKLYNIWKFNLPLVNIFGQKYPKKSFCNVQKTCKISSPSYMSKNCMRLVLRLNFHITPFIGYFRVLHKLYNKCMYLCTKW